MRSFAILLALVAGLASAPLQAQRSYTTTTRISYSTVRCESYGTRPTFCAADTRRGIRLAGDLSNGRCRIGQTWGYNARGIWVAGGCRADFVLDRGDTYGYGWGFADKRYVVCASDDYQRRFCPIDSSRGVRLVNQISQSACIRGRTWWRDARGIVVDHGCAGEFEVGYRDEVYVTPPVVGGGGLVRPDTLVCRSSGPRRRYCPADVGFGAVAMLRRIGGAACQFGRTWSYDRHGVWVSHGCSAEFEIGYPRETWTPGPDISYVRCESHDYERNFCDAPNARSAVLQRQLSRSACIEGRTWGHERGRIWVDDGCAGDFVLR
jgi:hypothetical protein